MPHLARSTLPAPHGPHPLPKTNVGERSTCRQRLGSSAIPSPALHQGEIPAKYRVLPMHLPSIQAVFLRQEPRPAAFPPPMRLVTPQTRQPPPPPQPRPIPGQTSAQRAPVMYAIEASFLKYESINLLRRFAQFQAHATAAPTHPPSAPACAGSPPTPAPSADATHPHIDPAYEAPPSQVPD